MTNYTTNYNTISDIEELYLNNEITEEEYHTHLAIERRFDEETSYNKQLESDE